MESHLEAVKISDKSPAAEEEISIFIEIIFVQLIRHIQLEIICSTVCLDQPHLKETLLAKDDIIQSLISEKKVSLCK